LNVESSHIESGGSSYRDLFLSLSFFDFSFHQQVHELIFFVKTFEFLFIYYFKPQKYIPNFIHKLLSIVDISVYVTDLKEMNELFDHVLIDFREFLLFLLFGLGQEVT
jgi:hypothetical protein